MEPTKRTQNTEFSAFGSLLQARQNQQKPPAYPWQDLALRAIKELNAPPFKRSAIFKICKNLPKEVVERCLADTRELCKTGSKWQYFFKIVDNLGKPKVESEIWNLESGKIQNPNFKAQTKSKI